jgi:inosine/xanthosine triphosphate pyrophosphatase family protein
MDSENQYRLKYLLKLIREYVSNGDIYDFMQNNQHHHHINLAVRLSSITNRANELIKELNKLDSYQLATHMEVLNIRNVVNPAGRIKMTFASTNPGKNKEFVEYLEENKLYRLIERIFHFTSLEDMGIFNLLDTPENEYSFIENACTKSIENDAFIHSQREDNDSFRVVISEDSGLIVPSLNGDPGVVSARYSRLDKNKATLKRIEDAMGSAALKLHVGTLNNIVLLDNLFHKYIKSGQKPPRYVPAFLSTTASASMFQSEISNHTGVFAGKIWLGLYTDYRYGKIGYSNFLAHLLNHYQTPLGYNPIFIPNGFEEPLDSLDPATKVNNDHRGKAFDNVFVEILEKIVLSLYVK